MLAIEHFERLMAVRTGGQLVKHRRFRYVGSVRGVFGECSGSVRGGPRPDSGQ